MQLCSSWLQVIASGLWRSLAVDSGGIPAAVECEEDQQEKDERRKGSVRNGRGEKKVPNGVTAQVLIEEMRQDWRMAHGEFWLMPA